ncbi:MAG: tRNA (adenosine(37)-N6)-threonylcarbamoyltransferase complex dimerization subunit type 1 TsaB [Chloroflexi bacterium]|nr:tRNA (adenosine(37)-N6)-threonylcarbamoyltransferase complex dimerization subunit type 1 TsaB [Chloroflexota bacterium]
MYLIIDTSTRFGAVGLWEDDTLVRSLSWYSKNNHTSELMPAIDVVLKAAGMTPSALAGIAVAHGPGGFSALRVGLGVTKGLVFATGLSVVGVSTLEASAYPHRGSGLPVCALIASGRGVVAWARFQEADGWRRRTPDRITPVEQMLASRGRHTLFCGEGAALHTDAIREALGSKAHLVIDPAPLSRLAGLAELGAAMLDAGVTVPVTTLSPRYLRSPAISRPNAPKAVSRGG